MKIVLAPDSFKGSLTAAEVCEAIAAGIRKVIPEAQLAFCPMADGGEGTVQSLVDATHGRIVRQAVTGPLGHPVEAFFGILGDGKTGVIEMAAASGLPLVPDGQKNPLLTTTYGTGELIRAALDLGCTRLVIGIGGSATNDGGAGMATALGYRFLDAAGEELPQGGGHLQNLARIDAFQRDARLATSEITVACDVTNPLVGPNGASAVYGPQKGANLEMVAALDNALNNFAAVVKRDLGIAVAELPGAGAAGGLGAGLVAFGNARLQRGVELVIETVGLKAQLQTADLVITGEGAIDGQTIQGKTPIGVAKAAKEFGKPVLAIAGGLGHGWEQVLEHGIDGMVPIVDRPMLLADAIKNAQSLVAGAVERMLRIYLAGR